LDLIRKIIRRVNGVSGVSGLNEKNNEESYWSFPLCSVHLLSSRDVDLLLSCGVSSPPAAGP
jgi:hypothetical protein